MKAYSFELEGVSPYHIQKGRLFINQQACSEHLFFIRICKITCADPDRIMYCRMMKRCAKSFVTFARLIGYMTWLVNKIILFPNMRHT